MARGLEEGGEESSLVGEIIERVGVVVVKDDMDGDGILEGVAGEGGEGGDGGVIDHEDGNGLAAIDFIGHLCLGEVLGEGGVLRVWLEDLDNIQGGRRGGDEEEEEEDRGMSSKSHCG